MPQSGKASSTDIANLHDAITSRDNQWLKRFRAALSGVRDDGFLAVEGARIVEAASNSGLQIEALLVSDSGERYLTQRSVPLTGIARILRTSDRLFAGIADAKTPQGIAALVRTPETSVEKLFLGTALVVVLVGIQDPGNVGTILRTAEAFGATGVAACASGTLGTADPFGPKAIRASAGSAFRLPVVPGLSTDVLLKELRVTGIKIFAAIADVEENSEAPKHRMHKASPRPLKPWEINWTSPAALLIGNEGAGLPEDIIRNADERVCIPQAAAKSSGGVESLNAAMAATVLLYEAMRQRSSNSKKNI